MERCIVWTINHVEVIDIIKVGVDQLAHHQEVTQEELQIEEIQDVFHNQVEDWEELQDVFHNQIEDQEELQDVIHHQDVGHVEDQVSDL